MASLKKVSADLEFEFDYSKAKDLLADEFIESPSFSLGGYRWAVRFYPHGGEIDGDIMSGLSLILLSKGRRISVKLCFYILDDLSRNLINSKITVDFNTQGDSFGDHKMISRTYLEGSFCYKSYFSVRCNIELLSEPKREDFEGGFTKHMEELVESKKRSDVSFEVDGKMFKAHRLILAARSPVFEAVLFGPMLEGTMQHIEMKDMRPDVFGALLHFMYTDELSNDVLNEDLLVAADRYALEKLKAMCEERLSKGLSIQNVLATLILADRHSCTYLKEKCLAFASISTNFEKLAFTKEYFGMESHPALLCALGERVTKKQRTF